MPGVTPCALTSLLANDFATALDAVNRKFKALQRFAQLLEQLGDLSGALPIITGLVPLSSINLEAYSGLLTACPFLNLPPIPAAVDIAALQGLVGAAYNQLIAGLNTHPFNRMSLLQAQMDKAIGRVSGILNQGAQFTQCLEFACGSNLPSFVAPVDPADVNAQANRFASNGTAVLTSAQQKKAATIAQMSATIRALFITSGRLTPPTLITGPVVDLPGPHPIPAPPEGGVI